MITSCVSTSQISLKIEHDIRWRSLWKASDKKSRWSCLGSPKFIEMSSTLKRPKLHSWLYVKNIAVSVPQQIQRPSLHILIQGRLEPVICCRDIARSETSSRATVDIVTWRLEPSHSWSLRYLLIERCQTCRPQEHIVVIEQLKQVQILSQPIRH